MTRTSPATLFLGLAAGHTAWGLYAYRDQLGGLVRDLPDAVGDGIFQADHSRDARAAAFWFLLAGPLLALAGRLYRSAEAAGDRRAMRDAGRIVTAIGAGGTVAMPRSGFPGGMALGLWLMRRARS